MGAAIPLQTFFSKPCIIKVCVFHKNISHRCLAWNKRQKILGLSQQGFHCFIICLLRHCSVLGFSCLLFYISSSFHCFIICLLRHCSVLSFDCLIFFLFCHYPISSSLGSSIKYVTLEGEGVREVVTVCERGRVKSM